MRTMTTPILYLVIPCYNEEAVLPVTKPLFVNALEKLTAKGKISCQSRILYVDDGSRDRTWAILRRMSAGDDRILAIRQSRNRGHQNALLAGLMEAKGLCDITVSMDCDGQDDVNALEAMVDAYQEGCEIVYGVRSSREVDAPFKRMSAEWFYRILSWMGAEVVYNHADYRLMSARALKMIAGLGILLAVLSLAGILWAVVQALMGNTVTGWASMVCLICFLSGIQLLCLGVIGEYIGKIYMETKGETPVYHQ